MLLLQVNLFLMLRIYLLKNIFIKKNKKAIENRFIVVIGGGHAYGGSENIEIIDTMTGESKGVT